MLVISQQFFVPAVVLLLPNGHTLAHTNTHGDIRTLGRIFNQFAKLFNYKSISFGSKQTDNKVNSLCGGLHTHTHTHTNLSIVCASIKLISATHEIFERCNECDKVAAHFLVFFFFSPCDCVLINCSASQLAAMTTTGTGPICVPVGVCGVCLFLGYYAMTSKCSTKATQSSVYKLRIT